MTSAETVIPHRRLLLARYRRERDRLMQAQLDEIDQGAPGCGKRIALLICQRGDVERALQEVSQRGGTDQDE